MYSGYRDLKPDVRTVNESDIFSATISQSKAPIFILPEYSIEYDKARHLEPYFATMDSAQAHVRNVGRLTADLIDMTYLASDKYKGVRSESDILLRSQGFGQTQRVQIGSDSLEVDFVSPAHWIIQLKTGESRVLSIEYIILENSKNQFRFKRIINSSTTSLSYNHVYSKVDDLFILVELVVAETDHVLGHETLLNKLVFKDFAIEYRD